MLNNKNARTATTKAAIACTLAVTLALSPSGAALALPAPTNQACANAVQTAYIGAKKAKSIALKVVGFTRKQCHLLDTEPNFDRDGGSAHCDADLKVGNREYECDINAITGEVISYFVEIDV